MTRLQTLQTLLEREEQLRDDALVALRQVQQQAQSAQAQAQSLVDYRAEYRQRWASEFAQGGAIEIVRCYHAFVARLELAIGQAQATARQFDGALARARERVQAREIRVATVQRLLDRHARTLAQAQAMREQKSLDELSQRRRPGAPVFGFA